MTDAKSKEPIEDEVFEHLPPAFKLLVEFARQKGIIKNERRPIDVSKDEGGQKHAEAAGQ